MKGLKAIQDGPMAKKLVFLVKCAREPLAIPVGHIKYRKLVGEVSDSIYQQH